MAALDRTLVLILLALVVAVAMPANASLAAAATFDEKVENAAAIVVGKCVRTESRFDPSGRWIVTYSTFAIEQSIKGTPAQTITVVTPGGSVNGMHQSSVGIPSFREGSENVLFIRNSKLGPTVLYFDQGAYDVTRNDRGDMIVAPVATDMVHIDTQRGVAVPAEQPRTLQDFRDAVARSIRGAADQKMKMDVMPKPHMREASIGGVFADYKLLIAAAIIGLFLAGQQLRRQ